MVALSKWLVASVTTLVLAAIAFTAAAQNISHEELMHKIQQAKTRAEHEEIAGMYEQEARNERNAADEHRKTESLYKNFDPSAGGRNPGQLARHCKNIADTYERAAHEHEALAALHHQAATEAR